MIAKGWASKHLSEAARKRGMDWNGYLCYEEDCLFAVAAIEMPQHWAAMFQETSAVSNPQEFMLRSLSMWNPEYLIETGRVPMEPEYSYYLAWQQKKATLGNRLYE